MCHRTVSQVRECHRECPRECHRTVSQYSVTGQCHRSESHRKCHRTVCHRTVDKKVLFAQCFVNAHLFKTLYKIHLHCVLNGKPRKFELVKVPRYLMNLKHETLNKQLHCTSISLLASETGCYISIG